MQLYTETAAGPDHLHSFGSHALLLIFVIQATEEEAVVTLATYRRSRFFIIITPLPEFFVSSIFIFYCMFYHLREDKSLLPGMAKRINLPSDSRPAALSERVVQKAVNDQKKKNVFFQKIKKYN
jgi:hypothetical protein